MIIENDGKHIADITSRTICPRHRRGEGEACWDIPLDSGYKAAVCGKRIKNAGFIGKISPGSMRQKSTKPTFGARPTR